MTIVMCSQKATDIADPLPERAYMAGTLGIIKETAKTSSGNLRIVVEGPKANKNHRLHCKQSSHIVIVEELKDSRIGPEENELFVKSLMESV